MKMPAFQFYPADWRKDPGVQALNRHDRSVWFDMLCIMHESDERGVLLLAGRPIPEDALARMLNLDNQTFNQTLTNILTYGVASRRESDGAIYNRRMVKDESLCQLRREAGKKGGNPNLVNQKPNQKPTTRDNQKPTPSSSTSSSTSSSEDVGKPTHAPAPKPKPVERRLPLPAEDVELFNATNWPSLVDPARFANVCAQLGYPQVDFELYRHQIAASLDGKELPASSLRNWIKSYLNRDKDENRLLVPKAQAPNDRPSNYTGTAPYVPPVGGRIPDMSSIMNTNWKPPQG